MVGSYCCNTIFLYILVHLSFMFKDIISSIIQKIKICWANKSCFKKASVSKKDSDSEEVKSEAEEEVSDVSYEEDSDGKIVVKVADDGNCIFACVAHQLHGNSRRHSQVRH